MKKVAKSKCGLKVRAMQLCDTYKAVIPQLEEFVKTIDLKIP
jgi:hypothetical protein